MPPIRTPAIVLATIRYGETSKIARLAIRDLGVQSAIAKGALRPKSRFGAALHVLSEGTATLHPARSSDLHTLVQFESSQIRTGLAERMDRFAAASLLSELMLRFAPASAHAESYDLFRDALAVLEAAPGIAMELLALRALWRLVAVLGFAPALDRCASNTVGAELRPSDKSDLGALLDPDAELPLLDDRHLAAHRRLLERYVRHHLAEGAELPALAFWAGRGWVAAWSSA